jgi:hypothetical protein
MPVLAVLLSPLRRRIPGITLVALLLASTFLLLLTIAFAEQAT